MFLVIKNLFVFQLYTKICFHKLITLILKSSTKSKFVYCAIVNYFDSVNFIDCVTWFSAFTMRISLSFNSFPNRMQVVYTVETLEF